MQGCWNGLSDLKLGPECATWHICARKCDSHDVDNGNLRLASQITIAFFALSIGLA
jgi:hypothetical protein